MKIMTSEISSSTSIQETALELQQPELSPIKPSLRIDAMDILRGFALIGILMMNIEWFNRPINELGSSNVALTGFDHAVGWLIRCFVEGKFYKLFALLFGMGFAVMLNSAIEAGKPFGAWFVRRMLVLFIFGVLHLIFLWEGDILHDYAFAGLTLLGLIFLFRSKRMQKFNHPAAFLKLGLWWLLLPSIIGVLVGIGFSVSHDNQKLSEKWHERQQILTLVEQLEKQAELTVLMPMVETSELLTTQTKSDAFSDYQADEQSRSVTPEDDSVEVIEQEHLVENETEQNIELTIQQQAQEIFEAHQENKQAVADELAALQNGTYWQATQFRAEKSIEHLMITPAFTLGMLIPIFLLGYWLISAGIMRNYQQHTVLFTGMSRIGLGVGLFTTVAGLLVLGDPAAEHVGLLQLVANFLYNMGQMFMAAGYLGLLMGLLTSPRWHRCLAHLAPLGRMALTNYLMHSLILTSLFYGYAGGLYGEVSRAPQMLIVIAIIGLQIPLSSWWLTRYRFGPLEWVWRSLTYKKWQAFKIQTA
jgi:uncharacterized protein